MFPFGPLAAWTLALCRFALAATGDDWRSRTIYQVITDRFARTDGSTTAACDTTVGKYCGGSWVGIEDRLDYIQNMGFDAIWISPVTEQLQGNYLDGSSYHGYWQVNINGLNGAFGSKSDLQSLAAELHSRGMYLMVDVVVNHYAWGGGPDSVDYTTFNPFNSIDYFHPYCAIDYNNIANVTQLQQCWEGSQNVALPDLRTEDSDVKTTLDNWIGGLVSDYAIDGLRIDSMTEGNTDFWAGFQDAAGVYSIGEVFEGDSDFVCSYQNYLPGVMNYAMYFAIIHAFESTSGSISDLANMINTVKAGACKDTSLLGTFTENHDNSRFGALTSDMALAKNAITFTMLTDGIPIIYQGQEQHYQAEGGSDGSTPWNREALWLSGFNEGAELYVLTKKLNAVRKNAMTDDSTYLTYQNYPIYHDSSVIAMRKGKMVTVLTNAGESGSSSTMSVPSGYSSGTQVTELIGCTTYDVGSDGTLSVSMDAGIPKVFYPTSRIGSVCSSSDKRSLTLGNSAKWRGLQ